MNFKLVLFLFFISYSTFGQNKNSLDSERKHKVDSLNLIIKNATDLNQKATHILQLSQILRSSDKLESRNLAKSVLEMPLKKDVDSLRNLALLRIGVSYFKEKKDSTALVYFLKMDSLYQTSNIVYPSFIMSKVYRAEISKFTFTNEGVLAAKQFLNDGLGLAQSIENKKYENLMLYRIGDWMGFYSQVELPEVYLDSANFYFNKTLPYYKEMNNHEYISKIYFSLASVASTKKDFKLAEHYYNLRLTEIEKTKDSIDIGNAHASLGGFYRKTKNYKKAIEQLEKAEAIHKKYGADDISKKVGLTHSFALTHYESDNFKVAANYFRKEINQRDSLFEQNNAKHVIQLETKYQTEKKEQEITLLKSESLLAAQQKINQRNLFIAGIAITSIAGLFFFFLFKNRQKTTKKLQKLDQFKSKLFANISHEFRTPLTLISGPIDRRLNDIELKEEDRSEFEMIQRNSGRLLNLVNQLLDLSKLESGHLKLKVAEGNLSVLLKSMASAFQHKAIQKNIDYTINIEEIDNVWFDKDVIEKTVINLLSNAFKYTPNDGKVKFEASIIDHKLHLYIENESNVLTKEQIENIFNRFYQADENTEGVGIGLSLVKELVNLSYGNITVENRSQNTIVFKVFLPILKTQFKPEELTEDIVGIPIIGQKKYTVEAETETETKQYIDENLPILLIVDDQEDIRAFIKSAFKSDYQVVEAADGEIGVEKAIELVPDIILSDVMMPKLNGFQLSETLKQDERTSHIPIILLTAKTEDADKFIGLETGADDYITKPFKTKALETRIKNLIDSRIKLRERYSQELVLKPTDVAISSYDAQFLEKVSSVIDEKIAEPSFSAEDFSNAVGMSRMQLHRKLKALTGLSATEFVRSQRLKLAADLLKKSDANVSEIGYSVGFNDHSYFTKCFKDMYGCTPTEFISKL